MAIRKGNKFLCSICKKEFPTAFAADFHRDSEHEVVYVPLGREDLHRLIMYIELRDVSVLTPTLINTLKTYHRAASKPKPQENLE